VLSGIGVGVWWAAVFSLLPLGAVRRVTPLAVRRRDIQPLAARDLTRVLRAVIQSRVSGGRIGDLLDVCDRRTLDALMKRAAVSPRQRGREIPVDQFLASQQFVPAGNAGLAMLRALLSD